MPRRALISLESLDELPAGEEPERPDAASTPEVHEAMKTLSGRHRFVVLARHGFLNQRDQSLAEIGRKLGVSRERVRQLLCGAHRKLQVKLASSGDSRLLFQKKRI